MQLYLDTGNTDEIKEVLETGLISGITTNPTLIAKEGRDFKEVIKEIISLFKENELDFTLSAEVTNLASCETIVKQGRELAQIDKHIIVKIPLTKEGLKAVKILSLERIRCNVTLCFSTSQALLAAKSGAWCVSPFVGRVEDEGYDGIKLLQEIKQVFDNYKIDTKILAASMRSVGHVHDAMLLGVDIVTVPKKIFEKMYYNPLTDIGVDKFNKDWEEFENGRK